MSVCALIAAAGAGQRMGAGVNKVYLLLRGEPVLRHALRAFEACECVDDVIVIAAPDEVVLAQNLIDTWAEISKVRRVVAGGATRQESVWRGIGSLDAACEIVVIHDGARPLVCPDTISRTVEAARAFGAAVVAVPVSDTIKVVRNGEAVNTLDRDSLWAAATPQAFRREIIGDAHEAGGREGFQATDDSTLVERMRAELGASIKVIRGEEDNIKITTPKDLVVAEALLGARRRPSHSFETGVTACARPSAQSCAERAHALRVGLGLDVHRLVPGRRLVLAGVVVPFDLGLEGHSDADVILHAIADAILGACGLGDIGRVFPDTDPAYAGIASTIILERVRDIAREAGFFVNNVDAALLAERPKIAPYVPEMKATVAGILQLPVDRVGIKATTTEGMGFVGRGEGMACYATCTVWDARSSSGERAESRE